MHLDADRAHLADVDVQILDLERSLFELERSLSSLRLDRTQVQQRLDTFKYPVLTLPTDIISEIFTHFLPAYPECAPLVGPLAPTFLARICRTWRDIALTTPTLWRTIPVPYENIPFERRAHVLDLWLDRSSSCPLSVDIGYSADADSIAMLSVHRARWERLQYRASSLHFPDIEGSMPLLRHLHCSFSAPSPSVVTFRDLPLLRTVILESFAARCVEIPWAQLTSLTLRNVCISECSPILKQAAKLVHCRLEVCGDTQGPDITLPHLESLVLTNQPGEQAAEGYLETLIVPALRSLEVQEISLQPTPIDTLTAFISKSGCRLQRVHIIERRAVSDAIYCAAFPSIPDFSSRVTFRQRRLLANARKP